MFELRHPEASAGNSGASPACTPGFAIATTNTRKLDEYRRLFGDTDIEVLGRCLDREVKEIQMNSATANKVALHSDAGIHTSNTPYLEAAAEIARSKAKEAFTIAGQPVIVEDTTLFLHGCLGQPGPFYSQFAANPRYNRILCDTVHILGSRDGAPVNDRATAVVTLARWNPLTETADVWQGVTLGLIPKEPRGDNGFGWDSIFIPINENGVPVVLIPDAGSGDAHGATFAEMDSAQKDLASMRARAVRRYIDTQVALNLPERV